ncbi:MAG: FHA domain-containing protein [Verrucomicrobia bacterium]|nr:FHA domain-containing protein [Verrucomicrobiota bacterium]
MTLPTGTLRNESTGEVLSLEETTEIGRSRQSGLPITDPRVSRRHAMIRCQADGFWFFDLGSVNGSYINERRVTTSQRLITGDVLLIADQRFYFEENRQGQDPAATSLMADHTIAEVKSREVVLLVSDIQNFTSLSEQLTPDSRLPTPNSQLPTPNSQ